MSKCVVLGIGTTSLQRPRILAAAARQFQRRGYPATTIRGIAAEVGLGASSLYNHIASKQELLREICAESAAEFEAGLAAIEGDLAGGVIGFGGSLRAVIGLHVGLALERPESVTVFNDEWRHLDEPQLGAFVARRRDYERRLTAMLSTGVAAGEFVGRDLTVAVPTLLASVSWVYALSRPERRAADALTEEIFALWARGWLSTRHEG